MSLKGLRDSIDEIDREIIRLLEKRFEIVEEIAKQKRYRGLDIVDGIREKNVLDNWMNTAKRIEPNFLKKVVVLILEYSKVIQSRANKIRSEQEFES
jgi:chorismate mutase